MTAMKGSPNMRKGCLFMTRRYRMPMEFISAALRKRLLWKPILAAGQLIG